ncbi:predicted protein [Naegleria gruberi]|uniref:Predicted protein n=1 Tax=Naegleria gruberi TaxID=5762 RepID=D2UZ09_NAEGR|nr:uncharacterized protein NAEGRDRAFT_45364 [Naegleria gruberi]EFC50068.1 predicted protein [Naegleria gruberi]|eukprot:XP_002682812.1 predicted protein [Naegleria gruberi strain NEG-M]
MPSQLDDDNSIIHCDLLIKEYLSWRGFTRTLTNFETDRKLDKNKAFQTDRIADQLFTFLKSYDIQSFMDYWKYLEKNFFPKLYESSGFQKASSQSSDQYEQQGSGNTIGGSSSNIDATSSSSSSTIGGLSSSSSQLDLMSGNVISSSSLNVSSSVNDLNSNTTSNSSTGGGNSTQSMMMPSSSSSASSNNVSSNVAPIGSLLGRHASSSTSSYYETIRKLEQSLKKYYVVNCAQNRRIKECREFFERFGHELIQEQEWRPWFALPYLLAQTVATSTHSASRSSGNLDGMDSSTSGSMTERERRESNAPLLQSHSNVLTIIEQFVPELEPFFNHKWAEMLYVCVQNFIATAIMSVEKPTLLLMESEKRDRMNVLKKKLDVLISENETLKSKLLAAEAYISKLEQEVGINRRETSIPSNGSTLDISDLPQESVNTDSTVAMGNKTPRNKSFHQSFSSLNISSVRQSNNSSNSSLVTPQKPTLSPSSPNTTNNSTTPTEQSTTSVFDNIQLFNLKPVYPVKVFTGHKDYITSLKFSQDGKYLASSSKDNTVRIWSLSGNNNSNSVTSIQTYECGTKAMCLDWWSASNGKKGSSNNMVVCGLNNRKVKILDLDKRKCTGEFCTEIFFPKVNAIACCGSTIRNSDYCVVSCSSYQKSDSGSNTPVPILPSSAGGNSSPSSSVSGMLLGYNLNQMKLENKFVIQPKSVPILDIKFNHNGTMIATAGSDGFVRIFDTASKQQQPFWTWKAHDGEVTNVHFSENETSVLTCGSDGKLIEWSIHNTGKVLNQIQLQNPVAFGSEKQHANWIDTRIGLCSTSERMFVLNYPGVIFSLLHNSPTHCLMTKDLYSSTQNNNATITAGDFSPMTNVDWFNAAFGGASGNTYQYLNWIAASHGLNNNIYLYNMDLS